MRNYAPQSALDQATRAWERAAHGLDARVLPAARRLGALEGGEALDDEQSVEPA